MIYGTIETQPRVQVPIDKAVNTSIFSRIESSVRAVKAGDADRQDMGKDISVYKVGKTIRVDIKNLDVIED